MLRVLLAQPIGVVAVTRTGIENVRLFGSRPQPLLDFASHVPALAGEPIHDRKKASLQNGRVAAGLVYRSLDFFAMHGLLKQTVYFVRIVERIINKKAEFRHFSQMLTRRFSEHFSDFPTVVAYHVEVCFGVF